MQTIRVGIAGFGMSAQIFHAPFLAADGRYEITKFFLRSGEKSKAEYPNAEIVRSFEELLTDDIDLVVLSVPNPLHYELAKQALRAGKHVVVEKPITRTALEAQELCDLAKKQGKLLTVYQCRRFDGDFRTVQQIVESGKLGEVVDYTGHFDRYWWGTSNKAWKTSGAPGINILYDLGVHIIDQAYTLFGMPKAVYADFQRQRQQTKASFDQFTVTLYYDTHHATLSAGEIVALPGPRYAVHGRKGSFLKYGQDVQEAALIAGRRPKDDLNWGVDVPENYGTLKLMGEQGASTMEQVPTAIGNYGLFYDNLYHAITEGAELSVKPEQTVDVLQILEAALQSGEEKRQIIL